MGRARMTTPAQTGASPAGRSAFETDADVFSRRAPKTVKRMDERDPRLPIAEMFSEQRARELWDSLPAEHRQNHFNKANLPPDYAQSFIPCQSGTIRADGTRWTSQALNLSGLPETMLWELAWYIHQEVADGSTISMTPLRAICRGLTLATSHGSSTGRMARSVTALSPEQWEREARSARLRRGQGNVGQYTEIALRYGVKRIQDRLSYAYHDGPWWRLNVWNPQLDKRIPQREHEPAANNKANFAHLTTDWLREAVKWWLSTNLLNGHYVWTSVKSRLDHFKWFQWYIDDVGCVGPHLVDDLRDLRPMMRGFAQALRQHRTMGGPSKGKPLSKNSQRAPLVTVENFYRFMFDNAREAAQVLNEPRWLTLAPQHQALFRTEDKPRLVNRTQEPRALEDKVVNQVAAGADLLARPKAEGGIGDEQAFRALLLQIRTGRRVNEILLMDFEPLSPLLHVTAESRSAAESGDGFVARMNYQQTKIESGRAAAIPIDREILSIIRAQQAWARAFIADRGAPSDATPDYLFLRITNNRLGQHPYSAPTYNSRLKKLTHRLSITDSTGRLVEISKTHDFRHSRATNLINAGVPIHVVMRYLGHVTPAMTMHYAQTLSETAEREFLRYKKFTADGRAIEIPPQDLFDLLHLDKRADRVLPNGWCALPPKQSCDKGNACLSCDKFVTDATHRDELDRQLQETERLMAQRQAQFAERYGEPMGDDNVWLAGRSAEVSSLRKVLIGLDQVGVHEDGQRRAIRGAGTSDRPDPSHVQQSEPRSP